MNRDKTGAAITNRGPTQPESAATEPKPTTGSPTPNDGPKDSSNTSISSRRSLKDIAESKLAEGNASQLGDPISLKAETSDYNPTPDEGGAKTGGMPAAKGNPLSSSNQGVPEGKKSMGDEKAGSLKEAAMKNPSLLGDPVSLKAEGADSEPTEKDRGAMSEADRKKKGSKL